MEDGFIFKYLNLPNDIMIIYAWRYLKLCWNLYQTIYNVRAGAYIGDYVDRLIPCIAECGSVAIKCCQWALPKLDYIYMSDDQIFDKVEKPRWHKRLEQFLEDCPRHKFSDTQKIYAEEFGEEITDEYEVKDVLGSGSIGQVYLLIHRASGEKRVLKIQHPGVSEEIDAFERLCLLIMYLPYVRILLNQIPFRISDFIDSFREQIDFVKEANNLLRMKSLHKSKHIIIPEIYRISKRALIMEYVSGETFDETHLNEYDKGKIFLSMFLFIRNNLICENFNHGDLHQGNWKVNGPMRIAIYDFGFCWRIPQDKRHLVEIAIDTFEGGVEDREECINVISDLMYGLIDHSQVDDKVKLKSDIRKHVGSSDILTLKGVVISPITTSKVLNEFCLQYDPILYIDSHLVQFLILFIQIHRMLVRYNHANVTGVYYPCDQIFKSQYVDCLTFCETYNIYPKFKDYVVKRLDSKQTKRRSLFDSIDVPESLRELALP